MLLRTPLLGFLLLTLSAGGAAEHLITGEHPSPFAPALLSPPLEIINVLTPEFGNRVGGGDYGLANVEPVEIAYSVGQGQVVRIVRTPDLRPGPQVGIRFQVLLGEVSNAYVWIETPSANEVWKCEVSVTYPDGFQSSTLSENVQGRAEYNIRAAPRTKLDFTLYPTAHPFELAKHVRLTISPVRTLTWSDELVPLPATVERSIINP
ncbi:MAG: hypothetical protein HY695_26055 [Deltaproteobacteria bacterium]|nr:hypothetical protein [Deltaproteobacteria bacterium]